LPDLFPPLAAGLDARVIPDVEFLIPGQRSQYNLQSFQPFGIIMTIADEHLRARWDSHGVPRVFTMEERFDRLRYAIWQRILADHWSGRNQTGRTL
jgi:hypothetical protein